MRNTDESQRECTEGKDPLLKHTTCIYLYENRSSYRQKLPKAVEEINTGEYRPK